MEDDIDDDEIDKEEADIVVIGATTRPESID